jgi:DNA-binding response OmpR family regulator
MKTEIEMRAAKGLKKILVVDDEPDIVALIRYQLEMEGYQVIPAYDGLDALGKVAEQTPDLVVLDIMMPKVDGWVVCHSIKSNHSTTGVKVIILSARTQIRSKLKGLYLMMADMYMIKPFDLGELSGNIAKLLQVGKEQPESEGVVQAA